MTYLVIYNQKWHIWSLTNRSDISGHLQPEMTYLVIHLQPEMIYLVVHLQPEMNYLVVHLQPEMTFLAIDILQLVMVGG